MNPRLISIAMSVHVDHTTCKVYFVLMLITNSSVEIKCGIFYFYVKVLQVHGKRFLNGSVMNNFPLQLTIYRLLYL
jgi:hypothetical protein